MNTRENIKVTFEISSSSPEETAHIGQAVGRSLKPGMLVTLTGTLGAGKTNFVQSLAEAFGIERKGVVSPTFTLIQIHHGIHDLVHIDAYRIADDDQYLELGIDEYIDDDSIVAMEWAEKFESMLPAERVQLTIEVVDETRRILRFQVLEAEQFNDLIDVLGTMSHDGPRSASV